MEKNDTAVFTLRLLGTTPETLPMDRFAEYVRVFSKLIGSENKPIFCDLIQGSAALSATLDVARYTHAVDRIRQASWDSSFSAHKHIIALETALTSDGFAGAEILDNHNELLHVVEPTEAKITHRVVQKAKIDGEILGVVGKDETLHVTVREYSGRIIKLLADVTTGRELARHLRGAPLRLQTHGSWARHAERGWIPDAKKCKITSFSILEDIDAYELLLSLRDIPNNGWKFLGNSDHAWKELRGINETALLETE